VKHASLCLHWRDEAPKDIVQRILERKNIRKHIIRDRGMVFSWYLIVEFRKLLVASGGPKLSDQLQGLSGLGPRVRDP
jgi:hypothetical protein